MVLWHVLSGLRSPGGRAETTNARVSLASMSMSAPRRTAWIVAPPEICCLCQEPLGLPSETSSWNGRPAHRDCVRVHLLQNDPAFRGSSEGEEAPDEPVDSLEGAIPRDDDDPGYE